MLPLQAVKTAKDSKKAADEAVVAAEADFATWRAQIGPLSQADFIAYAHVVVQPGYDYPINLYLREDGKLHRQLLAFKGASVLDILKIRDMSLQGYPTFLQPAPQVPF